MIYSLQGIVAEKGVDEVVLVCGGVGFRVSVPLSTAANTPVIGSDYLLYTYFHVKEDGMELYGFADKSSRNVFKMLISVSGVGPKAALSILSMMSTDKIFLAISAGDYKAFTACQGIGPKIAQRLVLELKDKVGSIAESMSFDNIPDMSAISGTTGAATQAVQALVALGYSQSEAASAIARLPADLAVEELIRLALQSMAGGR